MRGCKIDITVFVFVIAWLRMSELELNELKNFRNLPGIRLIH